MRSKSKVSRPAHSISPQNPSSFKRRRFLFPLHNLVDTTTGREEDRDMELLKVYKCICCNKGGDVVVCSGTGCPIGVHEECVEGKLRVDDFGRFYCPYCWYKRELCRSFELRKKVSLAKKAFSDFINFKPVGGGGGDGKENKGEENGEGILKSVNDGGNDDDDAKEEGRGSGEGIDRNVMSRFGKGKCDEGFVGSDDDGAGGERFVQVEDDNMVAERDQSNEVLEHDEVRMEDIGLNVNDVAGEDQCGQVEDNEKVAEHDQSDEVVENDEVVAVPRVVDDKNDERCSQEERIEDIGLNVNEGDGNICEKHGDEILEEEEVDGNICEEHEDEILEEEEVDGQVDDQERNERVVDGDKRVETHVLLTREDGSPKGDENISYSDSEPLAVRQRHFDQRSKYAMRSRYAVSPKILSPQRQISKKKGNQKRKFSPSRKPRKSQESPKKLKNLKKVSPSKEPRKSQESPKKFTNLKSPSKKPRKSQESPKNPTNQNKVGPSKKPRKSQESPKKFTNLKFATEKRRRLHWKPEEEEMLKEGVQKFSSTVNKNIPWRKILEFGRHIFDSTRTPTDLKDKWRSNMAREL